MADAPIDPTGRYTRQIAYIPFGPRGQRRLRASRVLIVGVGGLGATTADLLARAGVGMLRLVDDDRVSLANLHRQILFDEADAAKKLRKVDAAAERITAVNSEVRIEAVVARLGADNASELADGVDLILDGTDNFATRFIINDLAVERNLPWVFAGVVGAEGQVMTVIPGGTPCLRCVFDQPPPACMDPTCTAAGVLGPAVTTVASLQAMEALKLLVGADEAVLPGLVKIDFWTGQAQRIQAGEGSPDPNCPCCGRGDLEFLHPND